jgi:hypothetical protein
MSGSGTPLRKSISATRDVTTIATWGTCCNAQRELSTGSEPSNGILHRFKVIFYRGHIFFVVEKVCEMRR